MRESCTTCGMVANVDPSLHRERYGHSPTVRRAGIPHTFDWTTYSFRPASGHCVHRTDGFCDPCRLLVNGLS